MAAKNYLKTNCLLDERGQATALGVVLQMVDCPKARIEQKVLRQSRIDGGNFKEAAFTDCAFYHTRFTDCYFKSASFNKVRFIDCFFDHCNFDGAEFSATDLEYSEFTYCKISYAQIEDCFPKWQNVLLRLARSFRMNAQCTGDSDEYRRFLDLELEASETHLRYMFTKYDGYYKKYGLVDRLKAFKSWVWMKIDNILWGHGENWKRVVLSAMAVVVLFAIAFRFLGVELRNLPPDATFWHYLEFSADTFLALSQSEVQPGNGLARLLVGVESAAGLVIFGFLVTALYLRVSKR